MAYFTAVVARSGSGWKARDVEVDEHDTLDDLVEALRGVAIGDQPVLAVVEHEDEWFAMIRVDGDDDPRLFVSDLFAASRSSYAELLAPAADVDDDVDDDDDDEDESDSAPSHVASVEPGDEVAIEGSQDVDDEDLDYEDSDEAADGDDAAEDSLDGEDVAAAVAQAVEIEIDPWAGEADLLEDLGVSGKELRRLVEEHSEDPGYVLGEVGEVVGFGELLEVLR